MEKAHSINGVPGRYWYVKNPGVRAKGCHDAQKWISESRPVKGYGPGARLRVEIRFDDECKNGHNTFAITGSIGSPTQRDIAGGCLHEVIAQVFPELAHLIQWHLCATDGPMHYVANTLYHARQHGATHAWVYYTGESDPLHIGDTKERLLSYAKAAEASKAEGVAGYRLVWDEKTVKVRNLAYARSCACWPEATDDELTADPETLKAALLARLPGLLAAMRADVESMGFLWEAADKE